MGFGVRRKRRAVQRSARLCSFIVRTEQNRVGDISPAAERAAFISVNVEVDRGNGGLHGQRRGGLTGVAGGEASAVTPSLEPADNAAPEVDRLPSPRPVGFETARGDAPPASPAGAAFPSPSAPKSCVAGAVALRTAASSLLTAFWFPAAVFSRFAAASKDAEAATDDAAASSSRACCSARARAAAVASSHFCSA